MRPRPTSRAPHATGLRIKGTFSVSGVPASPEIEVGVIACPASVTFGYFCGTATVPEYGAFANAKKGTRGAVGTYTFGSIPARSSGWNVALVLYDGFSNGGYYPVGAPVKVGVGGATGTVVKALSMAYVQPQVISTFSVAGAPSGYHYQYDVVACPSSVTTDQLGIYEQFGLCAVTFGSNLDKVGLYLNAGSWTVRVYYEPYQSGVEMGAAQSVILSKFDIVGPTVWLHRTPPCSRCR